MYNFAVIGAGVIGLPTALEIQKKFGKEAQIVIFTEQVSPHTTGDVAAGLWTPYILQNTPPHKINQWAKATHAHLLRLWQEGLAKEAGISLQLMLTLSNKTDGVPDWVKLTLGYSHLSGQQIATYSDKIGKKFTGGYSFVSFVWEAAKFLPFMQKQFLEAGGRIEMRKIASFEELAEFDLVVNCSGLNSRFLVPDESVEPIRGQIARVWAPWQFSCLMVDGEDSHYVIPNQDCVILGGTHQVGDFSTRVEECDRRFILDGCRKYIPSLGAAPVLRNQAGLRPGRVEVRLEVEERVIGDKMLRIVHNYGHGGSGITLSIGCAQEAAQLVEKSVKGAAKL